MNEYKIKSKDELIKALTDEKKALETKIDRLSDFLEEEYNGDKISKIQYMLLKFQLGYMELYDDVLVMRLLDTEGML